jgi:hypothetical protein
LKICFERAVAVSTAKASIPPCQASCSTRASRKSAWSSTIRILQTLAIAFLILVSGSLSEQLCRTIEQGGLIAA